MSDVWDLVFAERVFCHEMRHSQDWRESAEPAQMRGSEG